jgi:hypothetical protein
MLAVQNDRAIDRQQRRVAAAFAGAALAFAVLFPFDVEAASCRGYPQGIRAAIKKQVEVLRALEREAADRLKGLDTRPFDYLLDRARAAAVGGCGSYARRCWNRHSRPPTKTDYLPRRSTATCS